MSSGVSFARRPAGYVLCLVFVAVAALASGQDAALAHHSYVTKYDPKKVVTLKGTISNVSYHNPHIHFDLTVSNRDGSTTTWRIETESIAKVQAKGLTQSRLQEGSAAVVTGWMDRSGYAEVGLKTIRIGGRTFAIRRTAR